MTKDKPLLVLFCATGDVVEFSVDVVFPRWQDETTETVRAGACYVTTGLVGFGWDLERVSGQGPERLRILNSEMSKYVVVSTSHSK